MLTSIRYNIYDNKKTTWEELNKALEADFKGYEQIQCDLIYNTPKFGNDDDYADQQAVTVLRFIMMQLMGGQTQEEGLHRVNMLPTTSHVLF